MSDTKRNHKTQARIARVALVAFLMMATPIILAVAAAMMANHLNETVLSVHPIRSLPLVAMGCGFLGGISLVLRAFTNEGGTA